MQNAAITLHDEHLLMLPERALYWPRTRTLFITDTHWGKAAALRASGIPVPEGPLSADLDRLSQALSRTGAEKLIHLGDLLHAPQSRDPVVLETVTAWRKRHHDLKFILVRGNHDRAAGDPPTEWAITCVDGPTPGPLFVLDHIPGKPDHGYALAGHLHPAVTLAGRGRQRVRLPCFVIGERCAVLPAFGSMTGGATITARPGDRLFAITERAVLRVT